MRLLLCLLALAPGLLYAQFPPTTNADHPGAAFVITTETNGEGRTGAGEFTRSFPLFQQVFQYDKKGKLLSHFQYASVGFGNGVQYDFELDDQDRVRRRMIQTGGRYASSGDGVERIRYVGDTIFFGDPAEGKKGRPVGMVNKEFLYRNAAGELERRFQLEAEGKAAEGRFQYGKTLLRLGEPRVPQLVINLDDEVYRKDPARSLAYAREILGRYPDVEYPGVFVNIATDGANEKLKFNLRDGSYTRTSVQTISHKEWAAARQLTDLTDLTGSWLDPAGDFKLILGPTIEEDFMRSGSMVRRSLVTKTKVGEPSTLERTNVGFAGEKMQWKTGFSRGEEYLVYRLGDRLLLIGDDRRYLLDPAPRYALAGAAATYERPLPEGYAYLNDKNYRGLRGPDGEVIVPENLKVEKVHGENLVLVSPGRRMVGAYDLAGNVLLEPTEGLVQYLYHDFVSIKTQDGEGILNGKGEWLVPLVGSEVDATPRPGLHVVVRNGTYGVVTEFFQPVKLKGKVREAYPLDNGGATVHSDKGVTVLTPEAEVLFTTKTPYVSVLSLTYDRYNALRPDGSYDLLDREGNVLLNYRSDAPGEHDDQYLVVHRDGKMGMIHLSGVEAVPATFDNLRITANMTQAEREKVTKDYVVPPYVRARNGRLAGFNPLSPR